MPNTILKSSTLLESGFSSYADLNKNGKLDKDEKQNSFILCSILTPKDKPSNSSIVDNPTRIIIYSGTSWITNRYVLYNLNIYMNLYLIKK